ncbi:MAG: TldD/PmbA family protein [Candidatus Sericytochromatia bacterium]|nr:TldD/PmbA family protein [Candidatus Tanganyikabacteria bacterium]
MSALAETRDPATFDAEVAILLDAAVARRVDAELFVSSARATRVSVQDGEVEAFNLSAPRGIGIRVVSEGRVGYAFTESLAPEHLVAALERAGANAALLPPDDSAGLERFAGETPDVALYNPSLAEVPVPEKVAFALALDRVARGADARIETVTGVSYADVDAFLRVASTLGVDRQYRGSIAGGGCMPKASHGTENKMAAHYKRARAFEELDAEAIAREAVRRSVEKLGSRTLESGHYPVAFHPEAFASLLDTFCGIFSGKAAQEGKSLLVGREGGQVAAPAFTLVDDPLRPGGFASRPFDDEGCVSRPFPLISEGVFAGFLHNAQTARKAATRSTGHASRGGYSGTVHVSPSNLVVRAGAAAREALLASAPQVVYVTELMGLHAGASIVSGDFSLQAEGFLHSGGDRHPIHLFTVSGNFYRLLEQIEALADDVETQPSGTTCPSVLVGGLTIAGK